MTDRAYIVSRTLENKIAIAENNDQNTLIVTLDVLKEILALLKEQQEEIDNLKQTAQSMMEGICLLKEQEAVEPTLIREGRNKHCNDYACPRCDNEVVYEQNYCSECGVRFLWEGR